MDGDGEGEEGGDERERDGGKWGRGKPFHACELYCISKVRTKNWVGVGVIVS
jgi:hypothetical protein